MYNKINIDSKMKREILKVFNDGTDTRIETIPYALFNEYDNAMAIKFVGHPSEDGSKIQLASFFLSYFGTDIVSLKKGRLIIRFNDFEKSVTFNISDIMTHGMEQHLDFGVSAYSKVMGIKLRGNEGGSHILEIVACLCTEEVIQKLIKVVCSSTNIDIRVEGERYSRTIKAKEFITYCQLVYNACYDKNAYIDVVEKNRRKENLEPKKKGCILILGAFALIISLLYLFSIL